MLHTRPTCQYKSCDFCLVGLLMMLPIFHSGVDEAVLDCQLDDKESRRHMWRPPQHQVGLGMRRSLAHCVCRVCVFVCGSHAQENKEDA